MDKQDFIATHCYLCSCIDCPQTEDKVTNCYEKAVEIVNLEDKSNEK